MSFGRTNYRDGGTRGGADQFKWDDVKNDKYRENYLGHSVNAPVGRWQKGKDLQWYTKASKQERAASLKEELALAKQRDMDIMNQALGIAPRKRPTTNQLDESEMKELLKRGQSERDEMSGDRIEGLGAAPAVCLNPSGPKKTMAQRYQESLESGKVDTTYALPGTIQSKEMKIINQEPKNNEIKEKKSKKKHKKSKNTHKKSKKMDKKSKKKDKTREISRVGRVGSRKIRHRSRSTSSSSSSLTSSRSPSSYTKRLRRSFSRSRSHSHSRQSRYRSRSHSPPPSHRHKYRSRSRSHSRIMGMSS